ncbi:trmH [Symbiodinium sp. CCMP2592]|nr:trmH [Symbiodinium sp. CCMP2592]
MADFGVPCSEATLASIAVIVENPSDWNNLERIRRACAVFNIIDIRLVQDTTKPQDPRCRKCLNLDDRPEIGGACRLIPSTSKCLDELAAHGYMSVATALDESSANLYDFDFGKDNKIALWFGQEKHGLTDEALCAAASKIFIPMSGMVQSLNVAASSSIILAEVARQRLFDCRSLPKSATCNISAHPEEPEPVSGDNLASAASSARMEKFLSIARQRQRGLIVVLEDPDRLDAAAILRGCDAFGVSEVHFIFEATKAFDPLANRQVMKSEGSNLWVCSRIFESVMDCRQHLDQRGFTRVGIAQTQNDSGVSFFSAPCFCDEKLALWLSCNSSYVNAELVSSSVHVPSAAKVAGLAISNLMAVMLAEVTRCRKTTYPQGYWSLGSQEQRAYVHWCLAVHAKRHPTLEQASQEASASPEYERLELLCKLTYWAGSLRMFKKLVAAVAYSKIVHSVKPPSPFSGGSNPVPAMTDYYRHDGVRITHDPYAPGMAEKYGMPGKTDNEGFDPYADTVGPGIYGGIVKRDESGSVVIGRQYQNHNPRPGPVYAGGGYTPINEALRKGPPALKPLLDKYPDLANDISTGGATPLHMCGMGRDNQHATEYLIRRGAKIEALDTYGMTPLHRMASNNLPVGAKALLEAGADPQNTGQVRASPMEIAQDSRAKEVMSVLAEYLRKPRPVLSQLRVSSSGSQNVNVVYTQRDAKVIPVGFSLTCAEQRWDAEKMWLQLSDQKTPWYEADNGAYIYWNRGDGQWWIDAPDGKGVYIAKASAEKVPSDGWRALPGVAGPLPSVDFLAGPSNEL